MDGSFISDAIIGALMRKKTPITSDDRARPGQMEGLQTPEEIKTLC